MQTSSVKFQLFIIAAMVLTSGERCFSQTSGVTRLNSRLGYYHGHHVDRLRCPPGWWMVFGRCGDIDECIGHAGRRPCPGPNTVCRNTVGSFRCECRRQHAGDAYSYDGCSPVNCSTTTTAATTTDTTIITVTTTNQTTSNQTTTATTTGQPTTVSNTTTVNTTNVTDNTTSTQTTPSANATVNSNATSAAPNATTPATNVSVSSSPSPSPAPPNITVTSQSTPTTLNLAEIPASYDRCPHPQLLNGSFFRLHTATPATWQQAAVLCAADHPGSRLAKITNELFNSCLHRSMLFSVFVQRAWIGLQFSQGEFRWTDDEAVTFDRWAATEPSSSAVGLCAVMNLQGSTWAVRTCDDTQVSAFLCEIPATP